MIPCTKLGGRTIPGSPTFTYGLDSEGRVSTVSASAGQNPLTGTTYNVAGSPTALNFGSGDSDSFTYDPNTNRMTQYQFSVNGQSLTSALTWNTNSTLKTQNIGDALNSADTQNCAYQYDDLSRVQSANCGSVWEQTFAYDPFGNISKTGNASFQATYSSSTNQITSLPNNFTPSYDADGNILNDSCNNYTWDANGRPHTIDAGLSNSVTLVYDALGRMVEQDRSGSNSQIVYDSAGQKLAILGGQNLQKALVSLGGDAIAAYNSSGLLYYGHADYLGSIRLATTQARGTYFDVAYAPFGETYALSGSVDPAYTGQQAGIAQRQDTVAGLYDFPVREYSTQARWVSPDPAGDSAACPKDPQTQNQYAYVRNNPLSFVDPLGTDQQQPGVKQPFFQPPPSDGGVPCFSDDGWTDSDTCGPCDTFVIPLCFNNGGAGGGDQNTQKLLLTSSSCTEDPNDRNGPGYTLRCEWDSPTQTITSSAIKSCFFAYTAFGHGHCMNSSTAIEIDRQNGTQVTVRCEQTVVIDLDCNPDSARKPYTNRVSTRVGPPTL